MNVLLNEYQLQMPDGAFYLPYASGLLAAYALKYGKRGGELRIAFDRRDMPHPDAVGYSVSQWNLNRSVEDALRHHSGTPVVFGGPSAPEVSAHPRHTVIVGEGEEQFMRWLETGKLAPITPLVQDLDDIPSPYVNHMFDYLVRPGAQAIVETVRGCPFGCAYCSWGKGRKQGRAVRFHSLAYVKEEAEWMGANRIRYVFCADGNFGMYPRDVEVAKIYARVKAKYGYPERFRVCFGKNAADTVYETARVLTDAGLVKAVTLSRQSTNPRTLELIGRQNVSQETFDRLQSRYEADGIPTYSELILGLPGETYESFKKSVVDSMRGGTQLFIYPLSVLPGTRLADLDYRVANGIRTKRNLLTPAHCVPPVPNESDDIVVETNTMDPEEWRKAIVLGWLVQLHYSFKLSPLGPQALVDLCESLTELANLEPGSWIRGTVQKLLDHADGMLAGRGRCILDPFWGPCYWEPEEWAYLELCRHKNPELVGDDSQGFAKRALLHARKSNMKTERSVQNGPTS